MIAALVALGIICAFWLGYFTLAVVLKFLEATEVE